MTPTAGSGSQLDRVTCVALLATGSLGRLVYTHRALPDVLPVGYRMDGESILIRLAIAAIPAQASRNAVVAFTVDEFDETTMAGWSVTAVGQAREILEPDSRTRAVLVGLTSWREGGRTSVFAIAAERLSGRRLIAGANALDR